MITRGEHDFITERCVHAWRGAQSSKAAAFRERVFSGCGHNAHLEAPNAAAVALRMWFLEAEDLVGQPPPSQTVSTEQRSLPDKPLETEAPTLPVALCIKVLNKSDAQQLLASWASEHSWADVLDADCGQPKQRERRPTRSVAEGLPHKDVFAVSRTLRNLKLWAGKLAVTCDIRGAAGASELHRVLRRCAQGRGVYSRLAVSMAAAHGEPPQLIACLEASLDDGRCGLRVVGSVAALGVPRAAREALEGQLRDLIAGAGLPIHRPATGRQ